MTNEKLEQRLAQALEKTAPHDVDGVLSRCEKRKGTEIPMKTKPHPLKKWMAMAACLALLLLCGGGLFLRQANAVASVVSIDVNPSIELRVNRNEKVLACVPMNDDARVILADMGDGEDLKGAKLDVAVSNKFELTDYELYVCSEGLSYASKGDATLNLATYKGVLLSKIYEHYGDHLARLYTYSPITLKATAGCSSKEDRADKTKMIKKYIS